MVQNLLPNGDRPIAYPDSDGQPMADNTEQFRWIVTIKENLDLLFVNDPAVFVAGDLLWYPVEGNALIRQAPDVMVVFGRPKSERGSYQQWKEAGIPPQVVFEILPPGNRLKEMTKKFKFYDRYGVNEYYIYDPKTVELVGWQRCDRDFEIIEDMQGWVSPQLGIQFELASDDLTIYRPDGDRFLTYVQLAQRVEQERQRANAALIELEQEKQRYQALLERLRQQGIDPATLE